MPAAPSPATGTAKPHQTQQSQKTSPGSSLPCGQGTTTAPTDTQAPAQPDGNTTGQVVPTNNSPVHSQFTPQNVTPQTLPIEQRSPIRTQTNPLSQNSIPAPEATVPDTPEEKVPKLLNTEESKIAGNKPPHPKLIHKTVDSASDVNSQVT